MTSETNEPRARDPKGAGSGELRSAVVLGLLAPPQVPAEVVEDLAAGLPGVLSERVSDRVSWEVPTLRDHRVPDVEGGDYAGDETIEDVREWRRHEGWDLAVCVTDLPLLNDGRAAVADASPQKDVALLSLPALGVVGRCRNAREAIVQLVTEVLWESLGLDRDGEERRGGDGIGRIAKSDEDDHLQLVMSPRLGRLRLLAGMVRATRPFRVVLGLSYALAAALGTAAFTILTDTTWLMADGLGWARMLALMVVSVVTMIVYLIAVHNLWERPSDRWGREYTVLFNATTVIALTIGALSFYAALFALTLAVTGFIIPDSVFEETLGHPTGLSDYAALAWLVSSLATFGGALGSGLETSGDVHEAAYTYHRERRTHENGAD